MILIPKLKTQFNFFLISKFDLVLMDPPWENKHVKRAKRNSSTGYSMLENDTIKYVLMRS